MALGLDSAEQLNSVDACTGSVISLISFTQYGLTKTRSKSLNTYRGRSEGGGRGALSTCTHGCTQGEVSQIFLSQNIGKSTAKIFEKIGVRFFYIFL